MSIHGLDMYLKQNRNSDFDMILFAELCLSKKRVFATLLAPSWALSGEMHQGELVRSIRMGFQSAEIKISIKSRQKINMHTKNKNKFQLFNFVLIGLKMYSAVYHTSFPLI